jgi:mRNA interferase MazF
LVIESRQKLMIVPFTRSLLVGHGAKTMPCVVVSPDEMSALSTVLMAPMTIKGLDLPCRVPCQFKGKKELIRLDQMRAVDKTRLVQNMGSVSRATQHELCNTLQELFAY